MQFGYLRMYEVLHLCNVNDNRYYKNYFKYRPKLYKY